MQVYVQITATRWCTDSVTDIYLFKIEENYKD